MRPTLIPLDKLQSLPLVYRATIPERYRDMMGHMNIRWYMELYDEAGIPLFDLIGLSEQHYRENAAGGFDLESKILLELFKRINKFAVLLGFHFQPLPVDQDKGGIRNGFPFQT